MFRVNKGVDRPPQVLGIRGMNFLMVLGGAAVGLLMVSTIIMIVTGWSGLWCYGAYLIALIFLYGQLVRISRIHGERGMARTQGRGRQPKLILVRSSMVYKQLRHECKK
ncbi:DUF4133 domain-containing protein [Spirosoma sp. 209]|uniref:DUF4133 domain-containing protein n=1 Tax=Spirosoma sp. 209 TaxID=1955701 RepID=UPI00098D2ED5|nr:DUF4133 domain-containing protein [Spirosoma sp. 209]